MSEAERPSDAFSIQEDILELFENSCVYIFGHTSGLQRFASFLPATHHEHEISVDFIINEWPQRFVSPVATIKT